MGFDYKCYAPDIDITLEIVILSSVTLMYFVVYFMVMRKYSERINGQVKKLLKVFSALLVSNWLYLGIMTVWGEYMDSDQEMKMIINNIKASGSYPICQSMLLVFFIFLLFTWWRSAHGRRFLRCWFSSFFLIFVSRPFFTCSRGGAHIVEFLLLVFRMD